MEINLGKSRRRDKITWSLKSWEPYVFISIIYFYGWQLITFHNDRFDIHNHWVTTRNMVAGCKKSTRMHRRCATLISQWRASWHQVDVELMYYYWCTHAARNRRLLFLPIASPPETNDDAHFTREKQTKWPLQPKFIGDTQLNLVSLDPYPPQPLKKYHKNWYPHTALFLKW